MITLKYSVFVLGLAIAGISSAAGLELQTPGSSSGGSAHEGSQLNINYGSNLENQTLSQLGQSLVVTVNEPIVFSAHETCSNVIKDGQMTSVNRDHLADINWPGVIRIRQYTSTQTSATPGCSLCLSLSIGQQSQLSSFEKQAVNVNRSFATLEAGFGAEVAYIDVLVSNYAEKGSAESRKRRVAGIYCSYPGSDISDAKMTLGELRKELGDIISIGVIQPKEVEIN